MLEVCGRSIFLLQHYFMRQLLICSLVLLGSCSLRPGSLRKLEKSGVAVHADSASVVLPSNSGKEARMVYLGCGGIYISVNGRAILVDPFFSHQSAMKIGKSVFLGKTGRKNFQSSKRMVDLGMRAISGDRSEEVDAIVNAHSHYDHLMDIPAVSDRLNRVPMLLMSKSAYNICHRTVDSTKVVVLEDIMSTNRDVADAYVIQNTAGAIHIYPILADHNPHFRNLKFFSGEQPKPLDDLAHPYDKTKANLWLEGNTFSFVIDFVDQKGNIDFRAFIQSSSCNPPNGIPPSVLRQRPVDVAFIGVVSYAFSPDYPCHLLDAIHPRQIVWVHWEDFFRKYDRKPKTVRGTDIPGFFAMPCVASYKGSGKILWPRAKMRIVY
jgi:hypothetical protein